MGFRVPGKSPRASGEVARPSDIGRPWQRLDEVTSSLQAGKQAGGRIPRRHGVLAQAAAAQTRAKICASRADSPMRNLDQGQGRRRRGRARLNRAEPLGRTHQQQSFLCTLVPTPAAWSPRP